MKEIKVVGMVMALLAATYWVLTPAPKSSHTFSH